MAIYSQEPPSLQTICCSKCSLHAFNKACFIICSVMMETFYCENQNVKIVLYYRWEGCTLFANYWKNIQFTSGTIQFGLKNCYLCTLSIYSNKLWCGATEATITCACYNLYVRLACIFMFKILEEETCLKQMLLPEPCTKAKSSCLKASQWKKPKPSNTWVLKLCSKTWNELVYQLSAMSVHQ